MPITNETQILVWCSHMLLETIICSAGWWRFRVVYEI